MNLDDFYDYLDEDPEVVETVDQLFKRLRSYKVVKLDFYRRMMRDYKGWRPMSLEDYAVYVRSSQIQKIKRELDKARQKTNARVLRQQPPKK